MTPTSYLLYSPTDTWIYIDLQGAGLGREVCLGRGGRIAECRIKIDWMSGLLRSWDENSD